MNKGRSIAVVGCGYWGRNHVRAFHELGVLGLICDSSSESADFTRTKYRGIPFTTVFQDVLESENIDGVVIATPAESHFELAKQALLAGKDVLVEKPLALSVKHGEELAQRARENGRILMVGHLLWYHPAVLKLKDMVGAGDLGELRYMSCHRLNFGKIRREENVLWSFAPHDVSVVLGLVDSQLASVKCRGGFYLDTEIADMTTSELGFANGVKANIFVSWLHPFKEQKIVVVGSRGSLVFDDMQQERKLVMYDHSIHWEAGIPLAMKSDGVAVALDEREPLLNEARHFIECMDTRGEPRTGAREGLAVLRVMDQCERQLRGGNE